MSLEEILYNLDQENIKDLYKNFKKSKDKKCQKIVIDLIKKQTLFQALSKHVDHTCQIILATENPESLFIIGKHIYLKKSMDKKMRKAISYSFFLSLTCVFSVILVSTFLQLSMLEVLFLPVVVILISTFFLRKILKTFLTTTKLKIFIDFLDNRLSLKETIRIFGNLGQKIYLKKFQTIGDLSVAFLDQKFSEKTQIDEFYYSQEKNFDNFCEDICKTSSVYSLVAVSLGSGYFIIKTIWTLFLQIS